MTKQIALQSLGQGRQADTTAVSAVFVLCMTEGFQFPRLSVKSTSQSSAPQTAERIIILCFYQQMWLETVQVSNK